LPLCGDAHDGGIGAESALIPSIAVSFVTALL